MNEDPERVAEELDAILALDADDPRRIEAMRSPRARALMREYEAFDATSVSVPIAKPRSYLRSGPRSRAARLVLLAASVAVLGVFAGRAWFMENRGEPHLLRGTEEQREGRIAILSSPRLQDAELTVDFERHPGATRHEIVFYSASLAELARFELAESGRATVSVAALPSPVSWQIVAMGPDGELARSAMQVNSLDGP